MLSPGVRDVIVAHLIMFGGALAVGALILLVGLIVLEISKPKD